MSRTLRMLIVDDEQDNLEYLTRVFHKEYDITCARTGREALEVLRRQPFDVIITDQLMPGITGVELLKRSLEYSPEAVRIVVTGFPDIETAIASINQGRAFRFFTKPLDSAQLADSVRRAVGEMQLDTENRRLIDELRTKNQLLERVLQEKQALVDAHVAQRTEALERDRARLQAALTVDLDSGALSARAFTDRLEEELTRAARHKLPCALIAVALEGLSAYGGRHGPARVGELMRMVHELIRLGSRRYDLVGRDQPGRLMLLLPMANGAGAHARAGRLREALAKFPFPGAAEVPELRFVVRTAAFPEDGESAAALLQAVALPGAPAAAAAGA
ncbi:MAG TPA: response regulator [Polyangia bacterium]|jgi:response regulator RpfG family c-di-GMP phosphodiesterase